MRFAAALLLAVLLSGCCTDTGKIYDAGSVQSFSVKNDRDADTPMTVRTEDTVYKLFRILEHVDRDRQVVVSKASPDCDTNTMLCLPKTGDADRSCAEIESFRKREGGDRSESSDGLDVEVERR